METSSGWEPHRSSYPGKLGQDLAAVQNLSSCSGLDFLVVKQIGYVGTLVGLSLLGGFVIKESDYNVQGLLLVALVLTIVGGFFLIPKISQGEGKAFLWFLVLAFLLKVSASIFRYFWAFDVKGGSVDAARYNRVGQILANNFWHLEFDRILPFLRPGTAFVEATTGVIYTFIGPTFYGGILFFACLAFIGSCLYYRAFRLVFPAGNRVLFAGLIFLYPSWVYWPSIIGKDALMAFLFGLSAYGTALLIRNGGIKAVIFLAIGLGGATMIRPQIAALLAVGIGVAILFRPYRLGTMGTLVRITMGAGAILMCWVIIDQAMARVGLEEVSLVATLDQYELIQSRSRGGSAFEPVSIAEPLGIPKAIITVLFRPFPWEAHRGAALILSLEGVFLLVLTVWRFGSIRRAVAAARSDPFLLFILIYLILFIPVFSVMGNFSIVGRQRLQMLPLFFMLLAYPGKTEEQKHTDLVEREEQLVRSFPAI